MKELPKIPHRFFKWYCRSDRYEELHGDLEEYFERRKSKKGLRHARINYWLDVIRCFRPYALQVHNPIAGISNRYFFMNQLKLSFRTLIRSKIETVINLTGLSLGLLSCLAIFAIIKTELSFDQFHENKDRVYRIVCMTENGDQKDYSSAMYYPMGDALRNDFPELEAVFMSNYSEGALISFTSGKTGEIKRFVEDTGIGFGEASFFQLFDFELISGNPDEVLSRKNTVILAESIASKYFDNEDPRGKTIELDNTLTLEVTGVYKDLPENTDLPFHSMLISFRTVEDYSQFADFSAWNSRLSSVQVYVLLPQNFDLRSFEEQLTPFVNKYADLSKYSDFEVFLQPLNELHTDERFATYFLQPVSTRTLRNLGLIGVFVLILACINFVNLSSAQIINRTKSITIRKILGSSRMSLTSQFLIEILMVVVFALSLALLLISPALSGLQRFVTFSTEVTFPWSIEVVGMLVLLVILVVLIAGLYPAILFASHGSQNLQTKNALSSDKNGVRKFLIVFQFAITQILVIGLIVVLSQINYFTSVEADKNYQQVISIPLPEQDIAKMDQFKNRISSHPGIHSMSFGMTPPMTEGNLNSRLDFPKNGVQDQLVALKFTDADYLKTYGLSLIAGRYIRATDSLKNLVINESLMKILGFQNPEEIIGERIRFFRSDRTIVGVIEDFHSETLHEPISPMVMGYLPDYFYEGAIRIQSDQLISAVEAVSDIFQDLYPEAVLSYNHYDKVINTYYDTEKRLSTVFTIFSLASIMICCIGLYGLSAFMVAKQRKEIGIRKVLGASLLGIIKQFNLRFLLLVMIALGISSPIAIYLMQKWLEGFVYRISISPWMVLLAGAGTALIAFITVARHAFMAANTNPVNVLNQE